MKMQRSPKRGHPREVTQEGSPKRGHPRGVTQEGSPKDENVRLWWYAGGHAVAVVQSKKNELIFDSIRFYTNKHQDTK